MALLLLPVEVLTQVIKETIPESFENFALSCKTVYHASAMFLEKHNRLRRRYRNFKYDDESEESDAESEESDAESEESDKHEGSCFSSLQLLLKIADDPLIARYIISADFKADMIPANDKIKQTHINQIRGSSNFMSLLETSLYLRRADVVPASVLDYFISEYREDGNSGLAATFLLTLLSNVTSLSLPSSWESFNEDTPNSPWQMSSLLYDIVERANKQCDSLAGLSRLTSMLPSAACGYESRWALSTFVPFLSIKSVNTFCSGSCIAVNDGYTGHPFTKPSWDSFATGLEVVELAGACVNGSELRTFLSSLSKLRSLKLNYETKWHGCGHDMDASAIMAAIQDEVGATLEELSFSVYNCYGIIETIVQPMNNFPKLKNLELDLRLVFSNGEGRGPDIPRDWPCGSSHEAVSLGNLHLPNLERLCLMVETISHPAHDLAYHLSNAFKGKREKMPNLKEIVFRYSNEGSNYHGMYDSDLTAHDGREVISGLSSDILPEPLGGSLGAASVNISGPSSDTQAENGSSEDSSIPHWRAALKALDPFISFEFIKVDGHQLYPSFMEDFF